MLRIRTFLLLVVFMIGVVSGFGAFRNTHYKARRGSHRTANSRIVTNTVEFVVSSDEVFPARALDPVLHIGDVTVRDYRYADIENKTLIFTSADPEVLQDGAPVYLEYEGDASTRTDLPPFRKGQVE
jgi:hypothetical protein